MSELIDRSDSRAWLEHGLITLRVDDPRLTEFERAVLTNVGARLYGERSAFERRRDAGLMTDYGPLDR